MSAVLLGACQQAGQQEATSNAPAPVTANEQAPPVAEPRPAANVALPDDRTPLEEPTGPIDPKSAEAAGQVVQHFGALIEQQRWGEAAALWGSVQMAAKAQARLVQYSDVHLEIGKPGTPEGAAGSIYVDVPVVFTGKDRAGTAFRTAATVILRRVNDVPGSSEAQRRWHIERIDWKDAA
jgi:hypothetical protein